MRPLTTEEVKYIEQNDTASISRIPIITTRMDDGNHLFDKTEDKEWLDKRSTISNTGILTLCKSYIPKSSYSLTLVFGDNICRPLSIAVLDMGKYIPLKERMEKHLDYPASLRDICRISLFSGAHHYAMVFNHPEQEIFGFKGPKLYEDELMLTAMLTAMPGPQLAFSIGVNMDKDPAAAFEESIPKYYSTFYRKADLRRVSDETVVKYINHVNKVKTDKAFIGTLFDFTLGGKLSGMDKSHLDEWVFYTDRLQKEPIRYDEWKMNEIQFTADLLIDPTSTTRSDTRLKMAQDIVTSYAGEEEEISQVEFEKNRKWGEVPDISVNITSVEDNEEEDYEPGKT